MYLASIPERSKGRDLRSRAIASWVRIPLDALYIWSSSCGLMAMTRDFESRNLGSIPSKSLDPSMSVNCSLGKYLLFNYLFV